MLEKIEIVRGADNGICDTDGDTNDGLLCTVCLSPDNVRHGIIHIVCEEGSPVSSSEHEPSSASKKQVIKKSV